MAIRVFRVASVSSKVTEPRVGIITDNVSTMLHAIFPGIARIPNQMGPGSALTSGSMIGYGLFW